MKKIISLLLVLVMMLGLVACGASKPAETEAPATEAPATEAPATETEAEGGCGSVIGFASVAVLAAAAAAVALLCLFGLLRGGATRVQKRDLAGARTDDQDPRLQHRARHLFRINGSFFLLYL